MLGSDSPTDAQATAPTRIVEVLLPMPLPEPFDYAEPEGMALQRGDVVSVPLGSLAVHGVVVGIRSSVGVNRPLKPVSGRLDAPALPGRTLEFIQWAARYGVQPAGSPLAMALRGLRSPRPRPVFALVATGYIPTRLTPARRRVLAEAAHPIDRADLMRRAAVSAAVIKALLDDGVLAPVPIPARDDSAMVDLTRAGAILNPSQSSAVGELATAVLQAKFTCILLDGVTGSGKTEVYLEAAAAALARAPSSQVLVLLPEIALTEAVIDRFSERFGTVPAQWHSGLTPPHRRRTWEAVAEGRARIVVGARSALFLPFKDLALIVVDEEHDGSYKQEEGFIYQARDLAVARAKIEDCAIILASATPSLETLWNAEAGRYQWLRLADRHGAAGLPKIELVDLRQSPPPPGRWLSPVLVEAMRQTLERKEQSLLFLNRRGYAPLVLCRACGERMKSPDSDSWLVEHRYSGRLVCHLTGFSMPKPARCPHCEARDALVSIGPGVERVEEEARSLFPEARLAVFSSDTMLNAAAARALIAAMTQGEFDILVATQSAAKGHNFPNLTLVGVVDADLGLRGGDLRAAERTYQLITQVSGRAGRRDRPGRALIQSWAPEHPVMQAIAAGDRAAFTETELAERRLDGLPPFGRLAALIITGTDPAVLDRFVAEVAAAAPNSDGVSVFGPADAPLSLVRGRRRKRFLVRADRSVDLQGFLAAWRARVKPPGSVRIAIDVDPYSFL